PLSGGGRRRRADGARGGPGRAEPAPRGRSCCGGAVEALARSRVEQVLLALADPHPDGLALVRDLTRVDAHDHLRVTGARVDLLGAAELVGERGVDERVRAELLDDVDDERD